MPKEEELEPDPFDNAVFLMDADEEDSDPVDYSRKRPNLFDPGVPTASRRERIARQIRVALVEQFEQTKESNVDI
jgi:hypothetical protein